MSVTPPQGLMIQCDGCSEFLTRPGALIFSPPEGNYARKRHLCVECWNRLRSHQGWSKP